MKNHGRKSLALRAIAKQGLIILAFLAMASPVLACPMCKDSTVGTDNKTVAAAESASLDFNKSIYLMLGGLVSVVGFTGSVMYKAAKSSR